MKPVPTQIIDEMEARLGNIKTANGYFEDLFKVDRARLTPWKGEELPAANLWGSVEERVDDGGGFQQYRLTVPVEIHTKTRDEAFTDLADKLAADVLVAMNRSTSAPLVADVPSMALGGLVTRIAMNSYTPIIGSGQKPFCGALIEFSILYRKKPEDPFTIYT